MLGGFSLDHHDRDVVLDDATSNDHVEGGALELGVRGECHPLAIDQRNTGCTDGTRERQASNLGGHGSGVDRDDVVEDIGVQGHDRDDDLDFVTQSLDKGRTQRAVDETAGQDRVFGGTAFATEERTGDATSGIHTLFNVNGQREEVELILWLLASRGCREQHGVAKVSNGGTGSLASQLTGFESDGAGAELAVIQNGVSGKDLGTHVGNPPSHTRGARIHVVLWDLAVIDRGSRMFLHPKATTEDRHPSAPSWSASPLINR